MQPVLRTRLQFDEPGRVECSGFQSAIGTTIRNASRPQLSDFSADGRFTREYEGQASYANFYGTTWGYEQAMTRCVEQMFKDGEIIAYLR